MSKPWGGMSSWAVEAEREEAEQKERKAVLDAVPPAASFPSLKDAVVKQPKKKKMALSEFYEAVGKKDFSSSFSKGLTHEEMIRLPTGPKERSVEEVQYGGRLGGGFRDQEGSWGGGGNRRPYGGGYDEERRGGPMQSRVSEFEPSRADGVDDWASGKKSFPVGDRPSGYGSGLLSGGGDGLSKADEVDNWAAGKKPIEQSRPWLRDAAAGTDSGKWTRGGVSFRENNGHDRTRLVLEPRSGTNLDNSAAAVRTTKPSPFGAARPREEVLFKKGLDWKKVDSEIEAKGHSRLTTSQSSRPSSAQSGGREENASLQGGVDAVVKPRAKVNPFGDAKPREVLLEEKGKDWRKFDMELECRVDRPETEEEIILKEEINRLKKELEKKLNPEEAGPDSSNIRDTINQKEKELEQLVHKLDDKIRFGQKIIERSSSGAGRVGSFSDRPPSRTGSVDEPKSGAFMDRPRSHGAADVWSRSGDERRSFQGGHERGFLGNRDMDRRCGTLLHIAYSQQSAKALRAI